MVQVEEYGLRWTIKEKPNEYNKSRVFLKQGSGLIFTGYLDIKLFWGPYIYTENAYLREDCVDKGIYTLPQAQWFFTPALEPLFYQLGISQYTDWYHKLQNEFTFFKYAFDRDNNYWRMSLTNATGSKEEAETVAYLFDGVRFVTQNPRIYVNYIGGRYPFLYVNNDTYKKLPDRWTLNDLYNIDKQFYEDTKKEHEQLWHNIAEARAQHKPAKIIVYDDYKKPVVYTERIVYGVALPTIVPYEEDLYR